MSLPLGNCLSLAEWAKDDFVFFFNQISSLKKIKSFSPSFKEKCVALVFLEPSTRTRVSFEKAIDHLGGTSILIQDNTSLEKGESLEDTVETLKAMGIHHFVIRSKTEDIFELAQKCKDASFINAGSGSSHHPTQGLLDAFTIWEHFGTLDGLTIVMVGDLDHSRVVRSNMEWMKAFDLNVVACGPAQLTQSFPDSTQNLQEAVSGADVVMTFRMQRERYQEETNMDYQYQITEEVLGLAKPTAILMHPGPVNRGVELTDSIMRHPQSKILTQVTNGLYTRIALLEALA